MSRRRPREASGQSPLPAPPPKPKRSTIQTPEKIAKGSIARRAKPSAVPRNVILTLTLDLKRELAERLSAQAIRQGVNLEAVVTELLKQAESK